ncbi:MAG: hypothetical protein HGA45_26865 [Chloroflexales bacterium]|nr:hypothetical protein [Chloroflexales bacterium]
MERWPASLEYVAQIVAPAPLGRIIHAPHIFARRDLAQAWCLGEVARQGPGEP